MELINPKSFSIESLYVSSILNPERMKLTDANNETNTQLEKFFNTICQGLIETWEMDENTCIEALKSINEFIHSHDIPDFSYSNHIVEIIIQLLSEDSIQIVKNALLVVINVFGKEKINQFVNDFLRNDIVKIIKQVFDKWETSVIVLVLYAITNIAATSKRCRDLILYYFDPLDLEIIISSTATNYVLSDKCKAFLKKLCYGLSNKQASDVFNLLVDVRKYTGNWIFEQMGHCARYMDESEIDSSLIDEAFEALSSDCCTDVRSALIFIGYAAKDINEEVIQLLNSNNDDISTQAIWTVISFIKAKGPDAVSICMENSILEILHEGFENGIYKKRVECSFCLCHILMNSSLSEINDIISLGLCSDLAEMLSNGGNQELSIFIINTLNLLLSFEGNEEIISEIMKAIDENDIYNIVSEEENSSNQILAKAATNLLNILENIEY